MGKNSPRRRNNYEEVLKEKVDLFIEGSQISNEAYRSAAGRALKSGNGEIMAIYKKRKSDIEELRDKFS